MQKKKKKGMGFACLIEDDYKFTNSVGNRHSEQTG